ncbi:ethylbenzene dehydrogenase-related protein [Halorhodospira halochloris]|uniref:ethylbenzene dehydrogenase-related protein n=1 Tax=Halorhodospira halochloris TaxID=1052 RepID=UPI001EE7D9E5|nr:ethylbenzene dehydrogenase-related protein [Halorhodospira halochloris]MCG5547247.1 ethylbenzene dehydrogenase-related protein [Halorhodospira halochloris]
MNAPAHEPVRDGIGGNFNAQGCFMACHDDLRNMPEDLEKVHDWFNENDDHFLVNDMGRGDMRHYILNSKMDGGDNWIVDEDPDWNHESFGEDFGGYDEEFGDYVDEVMKPQLEEGAYLDLWQARMGRSVPMGHASADYVFHYRRHNNDDIGGEGDWASSGDQNWGNQHGEDDWPEDFDDREAADAGFFPYIYDYRKTGYWAINEDELAAKMRQGQGPLITEGDSKNAIALYDTELFEWDGDDFELQRDIGYGGDVWEEGDTLAGDILEEGDLLPRRVLSEAEGARSVVKAFAHWTPKASGNGGRYDVVFVRDLEVDGDLTTDHDFSWLGDDDHSDSAQTLAFAIFDDHTGNRSHHVTMPLGLVGDGHQETDAEQAYIDILDEQDNDLGLEVGDNVPVIEARDNR